MMARDPEWQFLDRVPFVAQRSDVAPVPGRP